MGILQIQNINLAFGERVILDNASMVLGEHARAALAGGNGEGKSTLMKIIARIMKEDSGTITRTRDMRISYLPQSDIVLRQNSVHDEIEKSFSRFETNLERQHEIGLLLQQQNSEKLLFELNELQEELLNSTYYRREAVISLIAKGLGFSESDMDRPCSDFSGGYQMRIALAKVLAEDPDLMMLDEPTNYLDIDARQWLMNFLKTFKGSLLLVCHDRTFMDETVNEVYELFNTHLTRYSGNYSFYERARKQEIEQLEQAFKKQQAEIARTEQFIERFRYKATKSRQVQSRVKQLEKIEPVVVPSHLKTLSFSFPEPPHSPNDVVVINHMDKSYGDNCIFRDFSMTVSKGERIAVTGHNGAGKSTLLRIIAGIDPNFSGEARLGTGVVTGYYAQDTQDSLDLTTDVFSQVSSFGTEGKIRNALGSFLFSGDDIYKKASVLSGGERSRLALLRILLQPASLLILDEPTNHLDINAKDMLLKALEDYSGTIIFVSHDTYFIKELATRILYLSENSPEFFNGDYDYFEWKLNQRATGSTGTYDKKKVSVATKSVSEADEEFLKGFLFDNRAEANKKRNRLRKLEAEVQQLLDKTEELEMKLSEIKALMNLHENYSSIPKIAELDRQKKSLEEQISIVEQQWTEKSLELENEQQ